MNKAKEELESAPSILELFLSAKQLLRLQPRVENRQLRKELSKSQKLFYDGTLLTPTLATSMDTSMDTNMDMMLPDSQDDTKRFAKPISAVFNPKLAVAAGPGAALSVAAGAAEIHASTANIPNNGTNNGPNASVAKNYVTPTSMGDESPPGTLSSHSNSRHNSDTPNTTGTSWGSSKAGEGFDLNRIKKEPTTTVSAIQIHSQQPAKSNLTSIYQQKAVAQAQPPASSASSTATPATALGSAAVSSSPAAPSPASAVAATPVVPAPTECFNCHTLKTPLWRKDTVGNTLCNACGLFQKLHGTTRPLSLKTDVIKKRNSRRLPSNLKLSASMGGAGYQPLSSSFSGHPSNTNLMSMNQMNPNINNNSTSINHNVSMSNGSYIPSGNSSFVNGSNYNNALGRNSYQDFASTSLPSGRYNAMSITSPQSAGTVTSPGFSSSFSNNSNNNNILEANETASNSSVGSRYKNVLILPKPQGGQQSQLATPSSYSQIQPRPSISSGGIPIPGNEAILAGESPFFEANKRKRTDGEESGLLMSQSQSLRRTPSQVSFASYGKRGSTASFQSLSLNRRTSVTNLQRKNSILGNNTPPTALTPTNIGLLNQRFSQQTGGYFETTKYNGVNSELSSSYNNQFNDEMYSLPDNVGTSGIGGPDNDEIIDTDDFFKNYTSLHNDEETASVVANDMGVDEYMAPGTRYQIPIQKSHQVSSLTTGLKQNNVSGLQQHQQQQVASQQMMGQQFVESKTTSSENVKDLDWLKFEI